MSDEIHDVSEAFDIGRGISHGLAALKQAVAPMMVGGLIMSCTEGGGGGGGTGGGGGGGDGEDLKQAFEELMKALQGDGGGGAHPGDGLPGLSDGLGGLLQSGPGVIPLQSGLPNFGDLGGVGLGIILLAVGLVLVFALGFFLLRCWVHPGFIRLQRAVIVSGVGDFDQLFSGADRLWSIASWKLLKSTIQLGVFMVAGAPGIALLALGVMGDFNGALMFGGLMLAAALTIPAAIYVGLGLSMGELVITLEGLGAMDALDRSWALASGRRFSLLLFFFVFAILGLVASLVGLMMCCVGWFVTVPAFRAIYDTAFTEGFLLLTEGRQSSETWAVWNYA